jgi:hypothetical protein
MSRSRSKTVYVLLKGQRQENFIIALNDILGPGHDFKTARL